MSYDLLRGLYLGQESNADITSTINRTILHIQTPLDSYIPRVIRSGRDVVLTGNPGDGKSHLVRQLQDHGLLGSAAVELDLSARDTDELMQQWLSLRAEGRPLVLCANEGPLVALLERLETHGEAAGLVEELRGQLGHLVASSDADLPSEPDHAVLIDLADRNLLDEVLLRTALSRVCDKQFLPDRDRQLETSATMNLLYMVDERAQERLARVLALAGRRLSEHVTFRDLWATVSYAITAGKSQTELIRDHRQDQTGIGTFPLDNLTAGTGQGKLIEAVRRFADPAHAPTPMLDEDLWSEGTPGEGRWWNRDLRDLCDPPAAVWARGDQEGALRCFASLKRLVALFHPSGEQILEQLGASSVELPRSHSEPQLRRVVLEGIRRSYLVCSEEAGAPSWLLEGLPLWISNTYQDIPASQRPHVAASWLLEDDLRVRYPARVSWLEGPMGPVQDLAWLTHEPSGISLRIDPVLLDILRRSSATEGPQEPPPLVQRFLARLAGWLEQQPRLEGSPERMAVLEQPRGTLIAAATILRTDDGVRYA